MKNILVCNNCGKENPIFEVNCNNCGSYLRERIFNIDLWSTISLLIESPVQGFQKIIQSEHKNFLILILFLTILKYWVDSVFVSVYFFNDSNPGDNFFQGILITSVLAIAILMGITLMIKVVLRNKVKTRFKDLFSIITYSQIPYFFAALILFPLELIIFGEYLFSNNPSPFLTKETVAYLMLILEVLIIMWGSLLTILALYSQTGNRKFSIFFGIIVSILLLFIIFISSTIQQYL